MSLIDSKLFESDQLMGIGKLLAIMSILETFSSYLLSIKTLGSLFQMQAFRKIEKSESCQVTDESELSSDR